MSFRSKIRALVQRARVEAEMSDEIRLHLRLQTEKNLAAGMDPDEARYAALRQFGGVEQVKERCRDQRGWLWLENVTRDFRLAARSLRRAPVFSAAVIATLALCIGANTTIMSVLYGLILKPMPFRDSGQLVEIYTSFPKNDQPKRPTSVAQYLDYKANADLFEGFALWQTWTFNIGEDTDPERGIGARVTADYFAILGVQPLLGRFFTIEESVPGRDKVLVLTQTYWENKFHGDPSIEGRVLRLGGEPFTIIGVAPRSLEALNSDVSVLKPLEWPPELAAPQARAAFNPMMYARVRTDVEHATALAQLATLERRFQAAVAQPALREFFERSGFQMKLNRVRVEQTKSVRASLLLLQGCALFVLLLGCVNVANLMLARANARQAEIAVRQALGAGWVALARQMLVEAVLLAGCGAALGVGLTWAGLRLINTYTTAIVREVQPIALDGTLLTATLLVTVVVAFLIALLPIVRTRRTNLLASMQGGARGASAGGGMRTASGLLVTAQVALALILLVGACLLLRSFGRVLATDPGFEAHRVVQGRTVFGGPGDTPDSIKAKQAMIVARMAEIPGVEKVAYTSSFPIGRITKTRSFPIRGSTPGQEDTFPTAAVVAASPGYFEVMGIRLLEGRTFTSDDIRPQARQVFVVDHNFARKYFPDRSPVGETFALGNPNNPPEKWPMIVGVVAAAKLGGLEDATGTPFVFVPMGVSPAFSLLLRTERPASVIVPLMRAKLRSVDASAPLYIVGSLQEDLSEWQLTNRRGIMVLLGACAGLALLLSAVGIYGMLAYDVAQRTREIGIRGAIGATQGHIIALIIGQGLTKTGVGLGIGLAGAFYLSRYMGSLLFEVRPTDPVSFVGVASGLALIALLASWLPARRAAKVDPIVALRCE